ncbi:MAG: hypothetical protein HY821_22625 [Acidobacteria bacterium]|nr:hypothetical protein [Acidobacteriota bacterium]
MALLVDGDLNRVEELKDWDTTVLDVANSEGIDLAAKLRLAWREIEEEVQGFLLWQEAGELGQVQVDQAMRKWHALITLEAVYRDAYFSQLNDRYEKRWKHYGELAAAQERRYFQLGVATVTNPVRRPEAVTVSFGEGGAPASTYWVRATHLDARGRESAASEVQMVSSPLPHSMTASLAYAPAGVTHWNIYVGLESGSIGLQNAAPMEAGSAWTLPAGGVKSGRPPGDGQAADGRIERLPQMRRG